MLIDERLTSLFEGYHDVITIREAAHVVRCSKDYIQDLIHRDLLPYFKVGSHCRIFKGDVIHYFSQTGVGAAFPHFQYPPEL